MQIDFQTSPATKAIIAFVGQKDGAYTLCPPTQTLNGACAGQLEKAVIAARFNGATGRTLSVHAPSDGIDIVVLVGLGEIDKVTGATIERATASGVKAWV
jgi:leucyl aminopeptidase